MFGLPNSLLYLAAPIGASIIISYDVLILEGYDEEFVSHFFLYLGIFKFDRVYPQNPTLGDEPLPVAPSSLISPPEPVAAPEYGDIAVG